MEKKKWIDPEFEDLLVKETLGGPRPLDECDGPFTDEYGNDWWGGTKPSTS